jgi:hypothetical protein
MFVPPSQELFQVEKKGKRSVRDRSLMADWVMSDVELPKDVSALKILNFLLRGDQILKQVQDDRWERLYCCLQAFRARGTYRPWTSRMI